MKAVETAIAMKESKIDFYRDAVGKCSHPVGRKMFEIILADEESHLEHLNEMLRENRVDVKKLSPMANVRTAVGALKDTLKVRTACTLDEMEAFRLAMTKEKEAFDFFTRKANGAKGQEKALFEKLAHEEDEHYRIFSETLSFLDDTGNWYMWEEYSIVEG